MRYPRWDREKRIALTRLGRLHAMEFRVPGPRGGKGKLHRSLSVLGTGYTWSKCDVRLVTPDVLKAAEAIDRAIEALKKRKDGLFAERFYDLDPLTWEQIQESHVPWSRIWKAIEAYKKGAATKQYVEDTIKDVFQEAIRRSAPV